MAENKEDVPSKYNVVTEGKATVFQPASVFYNPVQEFNRDLTIAVISEFAEEHVHLMKEKKFKSLLRQNPDAQPEEDIPLVAKESHPHGLKILEGLAASGLRSIRFGLEIPGVNKIIANDFAKDAVETIGKNIRHNNLEDIVEASCDDAAMLMYKNRKYPDRFDVIDLDPYGSPGRFLDAALQSVQDGGVLCITCTDAGTLCGNFCEKAFITYGGLPLRSKFCHEMALRIILRSLESHATTYSRYIVPLLSLSIDFYFRVFVKVYTSPVKAKHSASKTGLVYHCTGCGSFAIQPLCISQSHKSQTLFHPGRGPPVSNRCEHCNHEHQIGGPLYIGPLHDKDFVQKLLNRVSNDPEKFKTCKRIEGMLSMAVEELDIPLYYQSDALFQIVHCMPMGLDKFRSAILNAGYQVSYSHAAKNSLKTNAPNTLIWDIIRAWVAMNPIKEKRNVPGSASHTILSKQPSTEVNFDLHPDAKPRSKCDSLLRWQVNPEKNWGPKPRAKKTTDGDNLEKRRLQNQGKRKRKEENSSNGNTDEVDMPSDDEKQDSTLS
ncbi:tRNA methyltransferase 1 [Mactra antiquata]